MDEDKNGDLITGDEPDGQAVSATELPNHDDSGNEAPLPQIGQENEGLVDVDDGGEQPGKTMDSGFGPDDYSQTAR